MNESVPNLLWDSAKRLYFGSPFMKVIFVCELISSIVATVFAAAMATAILLTEVLHFNIRLLLACTCIVMAISNVGVFFAAWYQVAMIPTGIEGARCGSFLFRRVECVGLKKLYNAGGTAMVMSTVFFVIERLVPTYFYETYESRGHKWMGVVLSVLLWMTFLYACFFLPDHGTAVYHYCDVGIYDAGYAKVADIVLLLIQAFAALIFTGLWYRNYRLKCTLHDQHLGTLNTRYQLKQNMNTTKLVSPLVAISAFLMLSYSVAYATFLPSLDLSTRITEDVLNSINTYAPIAELLILLMPIVTSAFVFWVAIFNIHVRRSLFRLTGLRHCIQRSSNKIHLAPETATRIHFEMLEKQMGGRYKRQRRRRPRRSQNNVVTVP